MRYGLALSAALLLACGCCNQCNNEMTRYHEDGRAKPIVAIASMIDTTSFEIPWSLSEEITSQVVGEVGRSGSIFVRTAEDFAPSENPFGQDLSWVKREFDRQEFVVFMELVQHELTPALKGKKSPVPAQELATNLDMAVRLRVVDLRSSAPSIVLQEMVRETYYIPRSILPTDYKITSWGTEEYKNSPMGIAHSHLIQEIGRRVSDYVLLAKSR